VIIQQETVSTVQTGSFHGDFKRRSDVLSSSLDLK